MKKRVNERNEKMSSLIVRLYRKNGEQHIAKLYIAQEEVNGNSPTGSTTERGG